MRNQDQARASDYQSQDHVTPSKEIKIKCGYILTTESKIGAKPAPQSLDKKSAAYYIIEFVNQKQKAKACISGNQAVQAQNQNLTFNTNSKPSKPNATWVLGNKPAPLLTKCFNCQETDYYS